MVFGLQAPVKPGVHPKFRRRRSSRDESWEESGTPSTQAFLDNKLPWHYFKQDILKLIHQLRIPRWRKWVDLEMSGDMKVTRISGAMTNAIYSIEPPSHIKDQVYQAYLNSAPTKKSYHQLMPAKLLLRVYGPQVDFLIDRDTELAILQRLAQKDIGPRMLGTFTNGRFEQFLDARPLTKDELRDPDTSVQIAKRMRELHTNVTLLPSERVQGPMVWVNYDKWVTRALQVLDELETKTPGSIQSILQSDLKPFLSMVKKYREWLLAEYGGEEAVKKQLVFAHNDTQYGNILRFQPPKGSPLLKPSHEHRQLVVIDFEYSAANVPGLDIANHFCEWMADYHAEQNPHFIWEGRFPSKREQMNMVQGYVEHGLENYDDEDKIQADVDYYMKQARDWRPAVNVYWCVWGIVQAMTDDPTDLKKREGLDVEEGYKFSETSSDSMEIDEDDEEEEDDFDYPGYSAQKAQLFWSDMIKFGFANEADYKGVTKFINDD